jgi:hypothetical protein
MLVIQRITSSSQYPYGDVWGNPPGSKEGYPPQIDPALGEIISMRFSAADKLKTDERYDNYCLYVDELIEAMKAATPAHLADVVFIPNARTCTTEQESSFGSLSTAAFVLSEFVDRDHHLVKIATLSNWNDFKCAVRSACPHVDWQDPKYRY